MTILAACPLLLTILIVVLVFLLWRRRREAKPGLLPVPFDRDVITERSGTQFEEHLLSVQRLCGLGMLSGRLAHDFNNLLMIITSCAEMVRLDLPSGPDGVADFLDEIDDASRSAAELCKRIATYSRNQDVGLESADISLLAEEMRPLLKVAVTSRLGLRMDLASGPQRVDIDVSQWRQVLLNMVMNAAEAMEGAEGEVVVRTFAGDENEKRLADGVYYAGQLDGATVCLEVSDSGCGMDETTGSRVCEPFFTTHQVGRGLGMSAVRGIVLAHGATLAIASRPGQGTTVRVCIPAVVE